MKKSSLKKKLFIAGANLLVLLALLIYVSYSAYRLKVAAELEMMEAAKMHASIEMTYDLTNGPINDPAVEGYPPSQLVLDQLLPGEDAEAYANSSLSNPATTSEAQKKGREVSFTVTSKASASEATLSEVPLCFKVVIEETGPIPLEIVLKDADNNKIVGKAYTDTSYGYDSPKTARFYSIEGDESDKKECFFFLNNLEMDHKRNLKLYFGWNNDLKTSYVEANQKEVAIINVKAEITQAPPLVIETPVKASPSTISDLNVYMRVK